MTYWKLWLRTAINTKQAAQMKWHLVEGLHLPRTYTNRVHNTSHGSKILIEAKGKCQCDRLNPPPLPPKAVPLTW
jgi:hypothetical protein